MLATLLEKFKIAIQDPECLFCHADLTGSQPFCQHCTNRLGLREAHPILRVGLFQSHAATLFNPAFKRLLYQYKFHHKTQHTDTLVALLTQYWQQQPVLPEVLVTSIPAHPQRQDTVAPIAMKFARYFGYPYQAGLLEWCRKVEPQHTLFGKRKRYENLLGSLQVNSDGVAGGKTILIVDDLTTTGATLYEANQALHRSRLSVDKTFGLALSYVPLAFQRRLLPYHE